MDPALPGTDRPLARPGGADGVRLSEPRPGDRAWMARALEQARCSALLGEVPVGAVLVRGEGPPGQAALVAEGGNRTLSRPDPTAHAEVEVLRAAARRLGGWHLGGHTLYVTLEPCAQCAGSLVLARVDRVVYAAFDPKTGMAGSLGNLLQDPRLNHRVELTAGVLASASSRLLRAFFAARRSSGGRRGRGRGIPLLAAVLLAAGCTRVGAPPPPAPADLPPPWAERAQTAPEAGQGTTGAVPDPRVEPAPELRPGSGAGQEPRGAPPTETRPAVAAPPAETRPAVPTPPAAPTAPELAAPPGVLPTPGLPSAPAVATAAPGPRPLPAAVPGEVRAFWVVRTALVHPDSVRAVVRRAEAAGANTLLVQVRGRGDAWYRSSLEPRPLQLAHLPESFDPLALLLAEARPRGIQVHAWINVHFVASTELPPIDPTHLLHAHPEWIAVPRALVSEIGHLSPRDPRFLPALVRWTRANSTRVEGIFTSPAHPAVRARVAGVAEELLLRYPIDGIHLDYVRFSSPDFDYSQVALEGFRAWLLRGEGEAAGATPVRVADVAERAARPGGDPLALPVAFPDAWTRFRQEQVSELVADVARVVRTVRPEAVLSAAVFPDLVDARTARFQAWDAWLAAGWLDVVVPMTYTDRQELWMTQFRQAAAVAGPERVWAGVGSYRKTFEGAAASARRALSEGAGGLALFSYDWMVGPEGQRAAGPLQAGARFGAVESAYLDRWAREVWAHPVPGSGGSAGSIRAR